jgi:hypothetical protein
MQAQQARVGSQTRFCDNGQNSFRATATDAPVHWLHAKQTNKPIEGK